MEESKKQFAEAYQRMQYDHFGSNRDFAWKFWQASRAAIERVTIVAYQDNYGNAVSAEDFDGGENEMHETAFKDGWTPLVCAAGIKVKE